MYKTSRDDIDISSACLGVYPRDCRAASKELVRHLTVSPVMTSPLSRGCLPISTFRKVVFPTPLPPTIPMRSPLSNSYANSSRIFAENFRDAPVVVKVQKSALDEISWSSCERSFLREHTAARGNDTHITHHKATATTTALSNGFRTDLETEHSTSALNP